MGEGVMPVAGVGRYLAYVREIIIGTNTSVLLCSGTSECHTSVRGQQLANQKPGWRRAANQRPANCTGRWPLIIPAARGIKTNWLPRGYSLLYSQNVTWVLMFLSEDAGCSNRQHGNKKTLRQDPPFLWLENKSEQEHRNDRVLSSFFTLSTLKTDWTLLQRFSHS